MTDAQGSPAPPDMLRSTRDLGDIQDALATGFAGASETGRIPRSSSRTALHERHVERDDSARRRRGPRDPAAEARLWSRGLHRRVRRARVPELRPAPAIRDAPARGSADGRAGAEDVVAREDPAAIGSPFFVMSRVEGEVPPDLMPYTFGDNWLFDAPPIKARELRTPLCLCSRELHAIERPEEVFAHPVVRRAGRDRSGAARSAHKPGTSSRWPEVHARGWWSDVSPGWTTTGRRRGQTMVLSWGDLASAT